MTHFGQTPAQLLNREHLPRLSRDECMVPLCSDIYNISRLTLFTPPKQLDANNKHGAVISVRSSTDRLIVVHADLSVSYYRWNSFPDGEGSPFQMRPERSKYLPCSSMAKSEIELKRKGFVPIHPIDPNMQTCPQVSLTTPKDSVNRKKIVFQEGKDESNIVVKIAEAAVGSAAAAPEPLPKRDLNRTSSAWSFFGAMRKNLVTQPVSPREELKAESDTKSNGKGSVNRMSRHNSVHDFDDCESDADFEDDEDDGSISREGDDSYQRTGSTKSIDSEQLQMADTLMSPYTPRSDESTSRDRSARSSFVDGIGSKQNKSLSPRRKTLPPGRSPLLPQKVKSSGISSETSKLSDINCRNIALSVGELGQGRIVSCGYWDNCLKVHALDSLREVASVNSGHLGEIVCVQLGYQGGHTLITGVKQSILYSYLIHMTTFFTASPPLLNPLLLSIYFNYYYFTLY